MSFNAATPSQAGGVSTAADFMDISMLPVENKESSTLLWQQQQYLTDSGINSAMETHTPSVCSSRHGQDEMEHESTSVLSGQHGPPPPQHQQWYGPPGGATPGPPPSQPAPPTPQQQQQPQPQQQAQTPQLSLRPQQPPQDVCMLSPGTPLAPPSACPVSMAAAGGGEGMADFGTPGPPPASVAPQGQPLQQLQNVPTSAPNAMDDSDMAASAIPDLCRLIQDEDQVIVQQAAIMVFQLSRDASTLETIFTSWDMMTGLVAALDSVEDPETSRCLAGTLYNLSQCPAGLKMIYQAGAIPGLVKLLDSTMESVQFYAITTLHNLLLHQEGAKPSLRTAGGLQVMVTLLKKNNVKFLAICTDCLQILAYGHQESKNVILNSGGPTELVRIMRLYTYEKLLWTTTRVLKVLSVCPKSKPAILEAGGMMALASHLHHQSQRLVHNCLWTLRNLSDAATYIDNQDDLLRSLVQLLTSNDVNMVTCAAGILSNLTCNNQNNKLNVFRFGGIEALLSSLNQAGDREEILEPCVCALRHLTSRHEGAEAAQNAIRVHNGLSVLSQVMTPSTAQCPPRSWGLCKAMVGLLRNLTLCPGNSAALRENGMVLKLINIVTRANQEIHRQLSMATVNPCGPVVVQGVRMQDVLEGSCAALHILARDLPTRALLRHSPHIHLFIQLLYSPTEAIQRIAAAIICELTQDREGAEVLEREGGPATQQRLSEMAHSLNEGLATYATAIMLRMSELREERQQALNTPPNPIAAGAPMQQWIQPPPPPPPPNAMGLPPGAAPHHAQGIGGPPPPPPPPHHAQPHMASPAAIQGAGQAPAASDPFMDLPPGGGSMLNYLQQGTPPQGPPGPPTPQQQGGPGPAPPPHTGMHARAPPPPRSIDSSGYVSPAAGYAPHYAGDPSLQPPWVYEGPPAHM